jgi:hypothetical protein
MPRNVSGTYSLPLPPVVPNTVIQAAWANTTENDIAQAITDSLDRNGRGGMIAPFRLIDGTVSQPAFAFSSETGTGLYRASAGVMGVAVMGVEVGQWSSAGYSGNIAGNTEITGNATVDGTLTVVGGILAENGLTALDDIGVLESFNGDAGFFVTNNSSGTLATSIFNAVNSSGQRTLIGTTSSGYTGLPAVSVTGLIFSNATQGLALMASAASSNIRFMPGGTAEIARFTTNGLGIGTSPNTTGIHLDVIGTIRGTGGAGAGGAGVGIRLLDSTGFSGGSITVPEGSSTGLVLSGDGGPMAFWAGGSQRVTITATGNVGIGPGNPGYALFVGNGNFNVGSPYPGAGATPLQRYMVFSAIQSGGSEVAQAGLSVIYNRLSDTDYGSNLLFLTANDNATVERMRIDNSGNIGIGLTPNVNGVSIQRNGSAILKLKGVSSGAAATLALVGDTTNGNGVQIAWYDDSSGEAARYALGMNVGSIGATDWSLYSYVRSRNELTMSGGRLLLGRAAELPSLGNGAINIRNDTDSLGDWNNFIHIQNLGGGSGDTNTYTAGGIAFSSFRDIAFPSVIASIWVERGSQVGGLASSGQIVFATAQTGGTGPTSPLEKMRIPYGNFPCSISDTSGNRYAIAIDTGPTVASIPIGAIVFGQATLPGGSAALTGLGTFAASGSNPLAWGGYTGGSATSITFGTWRNIGASTAGGVGLWMRVG